MQHFDHFCKATVQTSVDRSSYMVLMLSTMGEIFSRQLIEMFFLLFPENKFDISCGENLHEMSPHFLEKISISCLLSFAQNVLKVYGSCREQILSFKSSPLWEGSQILSDQSNFPWQGIHSSLDLSLCQWNLASNYAWLTHVLLNKLRCHAHF